TLTVCMIASIVLANAVEYAMDLWAMRCDDFYRHYEAGVNRSFIAASQFAADRTPSDQEIGVTYRIKVNGHGRTTAGPMRTFYFLTDHPIVLAEEKDGDVDPAQNPDLVQWAMKHNVRYFLWQPPI